MDKFYLSRPIPLVSQALPDAPEATKEEVTKPHIGPHSVLFKTFPKLIDRAPTEDGVWTQLPDRKKGASLALCGD